MRNVASQRLALTIGICLIALVASCRSPLSSLAEPTGTLTIVLPASASSRATPAASSRGLADHAGSIAAWRIEGTGPNGRTHDKTYPATDVSNNTLTIQLYLGDWQLTIKGLDADGTVAFTATQNVTVSLEETATCAMTLQWAEKALVARLSFDDTIKDDKGRVTTTPNDTGTWTPTASTASAPSLDSEKYLSFSDSEYIDVSPQELGTDISVSLWVGPNATTDQGVIMTSQEGEQANTPGFSIALYTSTSPRIGLYYLDGVTTTAIDEAQYIPSRWNHITVTIDNTNRSISLFVNGTKVGTNNLSYTIPVNQAIRIGNNKNGSEAFTGSLDDVRIYAGALSADDIAAIYADGYFSGGLGTAQAPYLVATPMDLYNVRYFLSAHYQQASTIDLSENVLTTSWTPIGNAALPFTGSYDGSGKSVSNIGLGQGTDYDGLFMILSSATITNLTLNKVTGTLKNSGGSLAGYLKNSTLTGIRLIDVNLRGAASNVGGLIGMLSGDAVHTTTISSIDMNNVTVAGNSQIGGLIGNVPSNGRINISYISVDTIDITGNYIGGLIGLISNNGTMHISEARITEAAIAGSSDGTRIGGMVGETNAKTTIVDSSVAGTIKSSNASAQYLGGFIGNMSCSAERCTANVSVGPTSDNTFTTARYIGGFAGQIQNISTMSDCHASGNVTGRSTTNITIGGFAGDITRTLDSAMEFYRCSATGTVDVPYGHYVGGFAGSITGFGITTFSFTDCSAAGNVTNLKGQYTGGFAGDITNGITFTGCSAAGRVEGRQTVSSYTYTGGFAGRVYADSKSVIITNCIATGLDENPGLVISPSGSNIGGFIGLTGASGSGNKISITESHATCTVEATTASCVGGFIGSAENGSEISNSWASGAITAGQDGTTDGIAGGFIGNSLGIVTVDSCYTTGTVSGSKQLGGFIGSLSGTTTIRKCYASGAINGTSHSLGGFAGGATTGTIENSYARGDVRGSLDQKINIAGFVGQISSTAPPTLTQCYSSGTLTNATGPFIGAVSGAPTYNGATTCFWHINASTAGLTEPTLAQGPTGANTTDGSNFGDWDESIWTFATGSYPTLSWEHEAP